MKGHIVSTKKIANSVVDGRAGGVFRAPLGIEVVHAFDRDSDLVVTYFQPHPAEGMREYHVVVASGGDVMDMTNLALVDTLVRGEQAFQIFVRRGESL